VIPTFWGQDSYPSSRKNVGERPIQLGPIGKAILSFFPEVHPIQVN